MKIYNYEVNEQNIIVSFRAYPLDKNKPMIKIADDEKIYVGFSVVLDGYFISNESRYLQCEKIHEEIENINSWFKNNDWKINKIITEEWTVDDPRWKEYLAERIIQNTKRKSLIFQLSQI